MEQVDDSEKLFKKISVAVKPIISDDSELFDNEAILNAIGIIEQCLQAVEREHLMSRNEELEDINTATMKFLFLNYYSGKCYQAIRGMEGRLVNVLAAKDSFTEFIKLCTKLGLVHNADLEGNNDQQSMTPDAKRQFKIDKYKRDKAAKSKINELQRQMYIARKDETDAGDHDAELRELYLTQIQCYVRESMDEIDMINQEITMLRYQEQQQLQSKDVDKPASTSDMRMDQGRQGGAPDAFPTGFVAPPPQPGPGISVTRTFKVGDKVMFSRDTVKATVFGSHIAPPTMSLEEFGDLQKAEALERQAQRPEDGAAHASRRYNQLEADGDEDDSDLVEQAAEKDRAWDDWKDNNPRGWGNKMGKRF